MLPKRCSYLIFIRNSLNRLFECQGYTRTETIEEIFLLHFQFFNQSTEFYYSDVDLANGAFKLYRCLQLPLLYKHASFMKILFVDLTNIFQFNITVTSIRNIQYSTAIHLHLLI